MVSPVLSTRTGTGAKCPVYVHLGYPVRNWAQDWRAQILYTSPLVFCFLLYWSHCRQLLNHILVILFVLLFICFIAISKSDTFMSHLSDVLSASKPCYFCTVLTIIVFNKSLKYSIHVFRYTSFLQANFPFLSSILLKFTFWFYLIPHYWI
jgi:hypothetical protein